MVSLLEDDEMPHRWHTYSLENTRNQLCVCFRREKFFFFLVKVKCFLSLGTSTFGPNFSLV